VVAAGVTTCVPPVPLRVKLLPSLPVRVTAVALAATTVSVELLPALIVDGFAARVTVGGTTAGVTVTVAAAVALPPGPLAVTV
jgi:hypothetical protein